MTLIYTDKHTNKVYALGKGFYSRTVTQYPAGTVVVYLGNVQSATAAPTNTVTFKTQAARNAWVAMMDF